MKHLIAQLLGLNIPGTAFFLEFLAFMKARKKFWMMPIFVVMLLVGGLVVFTQGSAIAPFIYTLF